MGIRPQLTNGVSELLSFFIDLIGSFGGVKACACQKIALACYSVGNNCLVVISSNFSGEIKLSAFVLGNKCSWHQCYVLPLNFHVIVRSKGSKSEKH